MKKRLLSLLAAAAITLSLSACKPSETAQETQISQTVESAVTVSETIQAAETTAPENDEVIYETLAEGQERDWKIEDVLKNDLEIDGISISIPCTVEELLETLGDGYSVEDIYSENEEKYVAMPLLYEGKKTQTMLTVIFDSNINYKAFRICSITFLDLDIYENGVLNFRNADNSYYEILMKYSYPDEIEKKDNNIWLGYNEETYHFNCSFHGDKATSIYIGLNTGGNENE